MQAFNICHAILGSFNQADISRFGVTAGTQCSCNALYAIYWSKFRCLSIWKTIDLDQILIAGDNLYKSLNKIVI